MTKRTVIALSAGIVVIAAVGRAAYVSQNICTLLDAACVSFSEDRAGECIGKLTSEYEIPADRHDTIVWWIVNRCNSALDIYIMDFGQDIITNPSSPVSVDSDGNLEITGRLKAGSPLLVSATVGNKWGEYLYTIQYRKTSPTPTDWDYSWVVDPELVISDYGKNFLERLLQSFDRLVLRLREALFLVWQRIAR